MLEKDVSIDSAHTHVTLICVPAYKSVNIICYGWFASNSDSGRTWELRMWEVQIKFCFIQVHLLVMRHWNCSSVYTETPGCISSWWKVTLDTPNVVNKVSKNWYLWKYVWNFDGSIVMWFCSPLSLSPFDLLCGSGLFSFAFSSCCCCYYYVTRCDVSHVVMSGNDYMLEYFWQQHPKAAPHAVVFVLLPGAYVDEQGGDEKVDGAYLHVNTRRTCKRKFSYMNSMYERQTNAQVYRGLHSRVESIIECLSMQCNRYKSLEDAMHCFFVFFCICDCEKTYKNITIRAI